MNRRDMDKQYFEITDQKLADKVAAILRVEQITTFEPSYLFRGEKMSAEAFVSDPRVAVAMLERLLSDDETLGFEINLSRDRGLYQVSARGWMPDASSSADGNILSRAISRVCSSVWPDDDGYD